MGPDVLRRVRWGNVALATAAAAALVAVVAWSRLTAPPPALPSDSATPLVRTDDRPARPAKPAPRVKTVRDKPPPRHRARTRRARTHHPPKRRVRTRRHARAPLRPPKPPPAKAPG